MAGGNGKRRRAPLSIREILDKLRRQSSSARYQHVLRVVKGASRLAYRFKIPLNQIQSAAALHDCAKDYSRQRLKNWILRMNIRLDHFERKLPEIWHGPVGAQVAERVYGVTSPSIHRAIRYHTVPRPRRSLLEKAIFVADSLEEGRNFSGVMRLRRLARISLEEAFLEAVRQKLIYVLARGGKIHPRAIGVWNRGIQKKR